ncbi:TetR/AcrR family transcriptional regulator [Streptomyces sp. N50]|uniref:TetR/AcrR family transcriptional regulator n=1 Tax=Streptomyces sp. N50 TaxID=3081765 RepID=UPI002962331E|nr:WHG domain-containing protein [Streptomyces sp. N50]WOX10166.1 WHG domain-containing protein [Streptomyces sp. N50]
MPRAGLTAATVTEAAATLVDEVGFDQLGMGLVAERLGVKTPSLYKHVSGQTDLAHRIAILAMNQCADAIRDAIQGRSGTEALVRGAQAMRTFVKDHHGRYAAANAAVPTGPGDPLIDALNRVVDSWAAMLHGYRIDPDQQIHALRMLRTVLHGYASLEAAGGFRFATDVDDSFTWMIDFIDHGLRQTTAAGTHSAPSHRTAPA